MAYEEQVWVDKVSDVTAERMNHMEKGITEASKTGGVLDGTIVEWEEDEIPEGYEEVENDGGIVTVTNDNGTAIKYPDGTMICTKRVRSMTNSITLTWGSCFMTEPISLGNFAENFIATPIVSHTLMTGVACWIASAGWASKSYCGDIRLIRSSSMEVGEVHINILAIGRWK